MSILMCIYNVLYLIFSVKTAVNQTQSQTTRSMMYSLTKIQTASDVHPKKHKSAKKKRDVQPKEDTNGKSDVQPNEDTNDKSEVHPKKQMCKEET